MGERLSDGAGGAVGRGSRRMLGTTGWLESTWRRSVTFSIKPARIFCVSVRFSDTLFSSKAGASTDPSATH